MILSTDLSAFPPPLELGPGTFHCPAAEAANALALLLDDTCGEGALMFSQLGAAPDLTDRVRELGLQLQQQLADAHRTAQALQQVAAG